jgi:predicted ABC-type ATPase
MNFAYVCGPNGSGKSTLKSIIRLNYWGNLLTHLPDKIEFLQRAQSNGYRTYLYYVATEDPAINISRVQYRVKMGGHSVPEDKIISRYKRSLDLLKEAIPFTNRAYIFDNSSHKHVWLAEITDGQLLEMKTDLVPAWFKNALESKFDI